MNLIGLGLGPLLVGVLSDALAPRYGDASLDMALAMFVLIGLWGAFHFWLCDRATGTAPAAATAVPAG